VKTGTTNDDRDAWIVGYTPTLAVGVWSGNNRNERMRSGGSAVSGPIWKAFMTEQLEETPAPAFEEPLPDPDYDTLKPIMRGKWMGNEAVEIDTITGMRATDATPRESREERVITDVHDTLYWIDKDDPRGPAPKNPDSDPQFSLWEPSVQVWWEQNKSNFISTSETDLPTGYDTLHNNESAGVKISGIPKNMDLDETETITFSADGYTMKSVDVYVNENYLTTLSSSPFRLSFRPKNYGYKPGTYTIKAVATDTIFSKHTSTKQVTITQ
jgi:membrane carboxypeptidase/penicillin-binding protein PbpC